MPNQNNDLPEGTDKVIRGASGPSGTVTTAPSADDEVVVVVADTETTAFVAEPGTTGGTGGNAGTRGSSGRSSERVIDKLRSEGGKLSGQAADKARGFVSQGLERSAEALANVGKMIGDTADGIDERLGQEYGDYARRAASAIESTANNLAEKDPDELIDDTREFVRRSPGVALAGAAIVGFAIARLIKSGLSASDSDDDEDRTSNRSGGSTQA